MHEPNGLDKKPPPPTIAALKAVCRKGGETSQADPFWISRYLYRGWTIYWTWAAARLGLTANSVTLISGIALWCAAVLYGQPHGWLWLIGALLVQIYFILDHVDGELGRYEKQILGRNTGLSGVFYDSACHPGEAAVLVTIAMRQWIDLGQPTWLLVLTVLMMFPGHISPWHRYCETLVVYLRRRTNDPETALKPEFLWPSSMSAPNVGGRTMQLTLRAKIVSAILQTLGFPGYFLTLALCTVLDVAPGVPKLVIGEQAFPYLVLWLIIRAVHNAASGTKTTLQSGRRLRELT